MTSRPTTKSKRERKAKSSEDTAEYVDMVVDMLAPPQQAQGNTPISSPSSHQTMTSKPRKKQTASGSADTSSSSSSKEESSKKKKKHRKKSRERSSEAALSGASSSEDDEQIGSEKKKSRKSKKRKQSKSKSASDQEAAASGSQHRKKQDDDHDTDQRTSSAHTKTKAVSSSVATSAPSETVSVEEQHKRWAKENSQPSPFPLPVDANHAAFASSSNNKKTANPSPRTSKLTMADSGAPAAASKSPLRNKRKGRKRPGAQRIQSGSTEDIPPPVALREQLSIAGSVDPPTAPPSLDMHESGFTSSTSRFNESGITDFSVEDWNDEPMEKFQNISAPPVAKQQQDVEVGSRDFSDEDVPEHYENEPRPGQAEDIPAPPGLFPNRRFVPHGAFRHSDSAPPSRANETRPMLNSTHGDDPSNATRSVRLPPGSSRNNSQRSLAGSGLLIEARLVPNEEELEQNPANRRASDLPMVEAKMFDEPGNSRCVSRTIRITIIGIALVLAGAAGAVLFLFLGGGGDDGGSSESSNQASAIEQFRASLPQATLSDLEDASSPQSRALLWLEGNAGLESQSMERRTQRFALATLYYSTIGDAWDNDDSWLGKESDECNWFSKADADEVCPDNGFVYGVLALERNNLQARIPRELSMLSGLEHVNLSSNGLTGTIPNEIGFLSDLSELDLSSNDLTGGLPNEISVMSEMDFLSFSSNVHLNGTIPVSWGSLTELEELHLDNTSISGSVPPQVCALVEDGLILVVNCDRVLCGCACSCESGTGGSNPAGAPSSNPTTSPTILPTEFHPWLNTLFSLLPDATIEALEDEDSPQSEAFSWMKTDPQIDLYPDFRLLQRFAMATFYFALDGVRWYDDDDWVSEEHECEWFSFHDDPCVNDRLTGLVLTDNGLEFSIPPEIGLLTDLVELILTDNYITGELPTTIGNLTNLQELWLDFNEIDFEIPTEIGQLKNLSILDFEDNHLTGWIPYEFGNLENLNTLRLHNNELSGELPESLGNLNFLSILVLRENYDLSGEIPESFENHQYAYVVDLALMNLTGTISKDQWKTWSGASEIDLGGNWFWGELGPEMGQLKSLTFLDVFLNDFSGPLPTELGEMVSLETLYLESNSFSGGLPSELGALPNLTLLHVYDNLLSGDVPDEICDRVKNHGLELSVDCAFVTCPADCPCLCGDED